MPTLPTRQQQPSPVSPQVQVPQDFPPIPQEMLDRFPSASDWQRQLNDFWSQTNQALQDAQKQTAAQVNSTVIYSVDKFLIYSNGQPLPMFALDDTGVRLGNVLVINTPGRKVYIGAGNYHNADTPFYVDTDGKFSLGANLAWDPDTSTLAITGTITATSGSIGGFDIGTNYIRDTANSFGLSSVTTGGDDVRFWAGDTFANKDTAPVRITESGIVYTTNVNFPASAASSISWGGTMYIQGTQNGVTDVMRLHVPIAGSIVFALNSDTAYVRNGGFEGNLVSPNTGLGALDTGGNYKLTFKPGSALSAARTLTLTTGDSDRTITLSGNPTLSDWFDQSVKTTASPAFVGATFSGAVSGITTLGLSGQITSTLATGTAPLVVSSTTQVSNLNVSQLIGGTWAIPGAIGSTTPNTGAFTGSNGLKYGTTRQLFFYEDSGGVAITGTASGAGTGHYYYISNNEIWGNVSSSTITKTTSTGLAVTGEISATTAKFGTHSAIGAETVTGYITITDAGGTSRKLAVVS